MDALGRESQDHTLASIQAVLFSRLTGIVPITKHVVSPLRGEKGLVQLHCKLVDSGGGVLIDGPTTDLEGVHPLHFS